MNTEGPHPKTSVDYLIGEGVSLRVAGGAGLGQRIARAWALDASDGPSDPACILRPQDQAPEGSGGTYPFSSGFFTRGGLWIDALVVDFRDLGKGCTLAYTPQTSPSDVLPWLNILLPETGMVSLHASSFLWQGQGVVVAGPAGSGKTGFLLAAVDAGAEPVGDECVWMGPGSSLRGLPLDLEVRPTYLRELPAYRGRIPHTDRGRAYMYEAMAKGIRFASPKLSRKLGARAHVSIYPHELLGPYARDARMTRLFLSVTCSRPDIEVRRITNAEAAARVVRLQMQEYAPLRQCYAYYRYLFPDRSSTLLDRLEPTLSDALMKTLKDTQTFVIEHPYPVSPGEMLKAMKKVW